MRHKTPLTICHFQPVGQELKDLTAEAEKLLRARKIKLPPSDSEFRQAGEASLELALRNTAESLAALALNPRITLDDGYFEATVKDFKRCYARFPDATLQMLVELRRVAAERQRRKTARQHREAQTQAGCVAKFLMENEWVAKKDNRLIRVEELMTNDFLPDRKTPKRGVALIRIADLQDGEIAQLISTKSLNVTPASVQVARFKLASQSKGI